MSGQYPFVGIVPRTKPVLQFTNLPWDIRIGITQIGFRLSCHRRFRGDKSRRLSHPPNDTNDLSDPRDGMRERVDGMPSEIRAHPKRICICHVRRVWPRRYELTRRRRQRPRWMRVRRRNESETRISYRRRFRISRRRRRRRRKRCGPRRWKYLGNNHICRLRQSDFHAAVDAVATTNANGRLERSNGR